MGTGPHSPAVPAGAAAGGDSFALAAAGEEPSTSPGSPPQLRLLLFQAQPCVSVYLLRVPAEPPRPDTLYLHISCKFEFDLAGWSPGGLLAAFETVAGSERSLMQ